MARILLVEDVAAVRSALDAVLTTLGGHQVFSATEGSEALGMLAGLAIDLVITDIWMPGEDGISFLRKAKIRWPELPVVIITGGGPAFPPIELSISVVEAHGADAVLIKPFEDQDLLDAVRRLTPLMQ